MQEQTPSAGETVIQQGDDGDFLFVVESGDLECWKKFNDDPEEKMVKALKLGLDEIVAGMEVRGFKSSHPCHSS